MLLYRCGTLVHLKLAKVKGMITAIEIKFDAVQYRVNYYDGLKECETWMNEFEFTTEAKKTLTIGFHKTNNS